MAAVEEEVRFLEEEEAFAVRESSRLNRIRVASIFAICAFACIVVSMTTPEKLHQSMHTAKSAAFLKEVVMDNEVAKQRLLKRRSAMHDQAPHEVSPQQLTKDAMRHKQHSEEFAGKSTDLQTQAKEETKSAHALKEKASKAKQDAETARNHAQELRQQAKDLQKQAQQLNTEASTLDADVVKIGSSAEEKEKEAGTLTKQADSMQSKADVEWKNAEDAAAHALDATAAQRACIHLPGVKLKGNAAQTFPPVVGEHNPKDEWQCTDWCLRHEGCRQAVFSWESNTCELFGEASAEPVTFRDSWPFFNSSYCGALDEKDSLLDMLHKAYDAKPWVPPPHKCSWSGDNCRDTKCCADVCDATWDFKTCKDYKCYKRDESFAGCKNDGPPAGWDGYVLGDHPNGEIAPAPEGKLVQGTRLYCFTVVMWNDPPKQAWMDSESTIANHWKEQGKGIMQCDDYSIFDGLEGGSVHNIQSFIRAWNLVKDDGRWKNNDWSIKVDPDAVFFPEHLRQKIRWNYRTPQGSAVYLRNTFYKFKFLGAIEALTREAMQLYFDKSGECEARLGQQGGEDYWLLQCVEGIGIDYQTDEALLHDKYAADENCKDPYGVAHHFFKKVDDWDKCWGKAEEAWNNAHQ